MFNWGRGTNWILGSGLVVLAGCTLSPLYQLERPGLERSLPTDVAMTDYVETDFWGFKVSVEEKLARLGAYSDSPGVIRDGTGKEIRFYQHYQASTNPGPEPSKASLNELGELKKRFNVIEFTPDPEKARKANGIQGVSRGPPPD
jgi:hypothetical protein